MDENRATVLVAGASGGTGREILRVLDGRDPTIRALTRDEAKTDRLRALGADEVVVGDLLAGTGLDAAVEGVDVVLSAVGSTPSAVLTADEFVDGAGTIALLEAAVDAGAEAFVMESALGVGGEGGSVLARVFDAAIGPIQDAKARAEAAIREADVRHTILRPGVLTNGRRTDDVTVAPAETGLWGAVSRADVARLMAAAPYTGAAADRTLEVVATPSHREVGLAIDWRLPRVATEEITVEVAED
ncbi:NAD(P)H-binding protein [Halorientalis pallida]|uniref:NAD-dependent epimerase/dehydratase family protein n=1 Tax=Halorientalis pallida TaxID=2479928 RepID=A0A498KXI6_9EURY|nr:NAD(P)H-binding protein [Halorientalis pallida]RXK50351.1 NAD-dependent epimerase/dehydratase family protein [Halorientalis pallida]